MLEQVLSQVGIPIPKSQYSGIVSQTKFSLFLIKESEYNTYLNDVRVELF